MSESPAETLRRAAKLMRERAEGCEPRRWHWEACGDKRYPQRITSDGNVALIAETFIDPAHRPYEAEHIASWSPPPAAAFADWLDDTAEKLADALDLDTPECTHDEPCRCDRTPEWGCDQCAGWFPVTCHCWDKPLAAARAYRGEARPS